MFVYVNSCVCVRACASGSASVNVLVAVCMSGWKGVGKRRGDPFHRQNSFFPTCCVLRI